MIFKTNKEIQYIGTETANVFKEYVKKQIPDIEIKSIPSGKNCLGQVNLIIKTYSIDDGMKYFELIKDFKYHTRLISEIKHLIMVWDYKTFGV